MQTAQTAQIVETAQTIPGEPIEQANLLTRDDTFFGICQGFGEDLGIDPLWPRLALALLTFWSPLAAVGLYAAMGVIALATRLIHPEPRLALVAAESEAVQGDIEVGVEAETDEEALSIAA
jgi:phage shock protein C